jgi:hypothetical protein
MKTNASLQRTIALQAETIARLSAATHMFEKVLEMSKAGISVKVAMGDDPAKSFTFTAYTSTTLAAPPAWIATQLGLGCNDRVEFYYIDGDGREVVLDEEASLVRYVAHHGISVGAGTVLKCRKATPC